MIWEFGRQKYPDGAVKVCRQFLIFPQTIDGVTKWMQWAYSTAYYTCYDGWYWAVGHWITREEYEQRKAVNPEMIPPDKGIEEDWRSCCRMNHVRKDVSGVLEPCPVPWCRNHTTLENDEPPLVETVGGIGYQVLCPECGCHGIFKKTEAEARAVWNKRC